MFQPWLLKLVERFLERLLPAWKPTINACSNILDDILHLADTSVSETDAVHLIKAKLKNARVPLTERELGEVSLILLTTLRHVYQAFMQPFLTAFEARIREYLQNKLGGIAALWLARMAEKQPKHPPSSLELSIEVLNTLQSRSGKSWDGYKRPEEPKTDQPSVYTGDDGWE